MKNKFILILVFLFVAIGLWFVYDNIILNKSKTREKIIVATDATYPPLEYIDDKGNIIGFDMDLVNEIAKDLKFEIEIKNISFDDIFEALTNKETDIIISSVTITDERKKTMSFTNPYLNAGQVIVAKIDSQIKSVDDLRSAKVGVQSNTTSQKEGVKYVEKANLKAYPDYELALKDIKQGKIEALIIDYPAGVSMVQDNNQVVKVVGKPFTSEFYGIVVAKDNQDLLNKINGSLSKLKRNGTLDRLESIWFSR